MCDCIAILDAQLANDGQCLNATLSSPQRAVIDVVRIDKGISENRAGRTKSLLATHCPWCGEAYTPRGNATAPREG